MYRKQGANIALESAPFPGGRLVAAGGSFEPHYHLTDHLGSTRVVVNGRGTVLERNNYQPFGMRWSGGQLSDNRYRYNGKEQQAFIDVPYTDYGARMYDPALGRWFGVDPLAEKHPNISQYAFCANNPIRNIDPDGGDWFMGINGGVIWGGEIRIAKL